MLLLKCCQIAIARGITKVGNAILYSQEHGKLSRKDKDKLWDEYHDSEYNQFTFCYTVINDVHNMKIKKRIKELEGRLR